MNTKIVEEITARQLKKDVPEFSSGDTVAVSVRIIENKKERVQVYEGVVIQRDADGPSALLHAGGTAFDLLVLLCGGLALQLQVAVGLDTAVVVKDDDRDGVVAVDDFQHQGEVRFIVGIAQRPHGF